MIFIFVAYELKLHTSNVHRTSLIKKEKKSLFHNFFILNSMIVYILWGSYYFFKYTTLCSDIFSIYLNGAA